MRKSSLWVLAAILACSPMFISCGDGDDNPIVNPANPEGDGFFSAAINKMIDENHGQVMQRGYAELVIPASMFDQNIFQYADYHKDVMRALNNLGYKTYINGGAVRDAILGTPIHDLDFSTDATSQQMKEQLTGYEVVINTTSGGDIAKAYHSNGDWTDMVPIKGINAALQGMPFVPADGAFGQTYSKSLLDDTYTRDLTINSLYYDFQTGDIIDYHGGLHDLRDHIVRTVYDANVMYPLNASSLIRTVRFAARYGYSIDDATATAIDDNMHYCAETIDGAMNNYYIMKGFGDGCATRTYQYYCRYGIVDFFIPLLKGYAGTTAYDDPLCKALDYLESKTKMNIPLSMAALFLPVMQKAMSGTEATLENITAKWDELEQGSGQKPLFEINDWANERTDMLNTFYVYFSLTGDSLSVEALDALKANASYTSGELLMEAWSPR